MNKFNIELQENMATGDLNLKGVLTHELLMDEMPIHIYREAVKEIAHVIAERVINEKGQEIFEKISSEAIANLTIAEAGNSIKDMLDKKLPDRVDTIIDKQIYQRGVFGGLKRIT